jgi:DNA repair exonuclease SbcCD ATPase subunit
MKIKKVRAKNFLSIGNDWIEIDFAKYGNIILIKGQNLDISPNSSNGAGKSTLIECIVYGFYGKMIKGLNHKEALNKKTKKGLTLEIEFEQAGEEYKIVRTRKPDGLELYCTSKQDPEDPTKPLTLTRGGQPATQEAIEELVKLSADAFINVVCLGEHNNHAFLSLKAEDRRAIVENLLGLEKYIKYNKHASGVKNAMEGEQKIALKKYDTLLAGRKSVEERIKALQGKWDAWKRTRQTEITSLESMITSKLRELEDAGDDGSALLTYHEAQKQILENKNEVVRLEASRTKVGSVIEEEIDPKMSAAAELRQELMLQAKDAKHAADKLQLELNSLVEYNQKLTSLQDGVKCDKCFSIIDKKNYETVRLQNSNRIDSLGATLEVEKSKIPVIGKKFKEAEEKLAQAQGGEDGCGNKAVSDHQAKHTSSHRDQRTLQGEGAECEHQADSVAGATECFGVAADFQEGRG